MSRPSRVDAGDGAWSLSQDLALCPVSARERRTAVFVNYISAARYSFL